MEYAPDKTAAYLAGKIDEYVKQQARDTVFENVKADRFARYARIPDGNACDFCRMLGSRGFVYHSKDTAGGNSLHTTKYDTFHPFCNCQIAVAFDPAMQYYYVGLTKVSRGYSSSGRVVATGSDKSKVLRNVDIDELFDEYKKAGRDYTSGSRYRDYETGEKLHKLSQEQFAEYQERLARAGSVDELHAIGDEIVAEINAKGRLDEKQWNQLSAYAKRMEGEIESRGLSQIGDLKEAVEYYASGEGMYVNQELRSKGYSALDAQEKKLVDDLDKATQRDIISVDKLYRSVDASSVFGNMTQLQYEQLTEGLVYGGDYEMRQAQKILDRAKPGKVITEKGFMSTSEQYDIISEWYDFTGSDKPITLELEVPKGTRGCKVYELTPEAEAADPQREVLLPRNTKYRIDEITTRDGLILVKATILKK